jgi:hypothetical protein
MEQSVGVIVGVVEFTVWVLGIVLVAGIGDTVAVAVAVAVMVGESVAVAV